LGTCEHCHAILQAIETAFREFPDDFTMVLYVVNAQVGGRLLAEDVEAYRCIKDFVPRLGSTATAVVVNQFWAPPHSRDEFMCSLSEQLRDVLKLDPLVCEFIDSVPDECWLSKDTLDYASQPLKWARELIIGTLEKLTPQLSVVPEPRATIQRDSDVIKAQVIKTQAEIVDVEARHKLEMKKQAEAQAEKERRINRGK
jgi:hypothetical protein